MFTRKKKTFRNKKLHLLICNNVGLAVERFMQFQSIPEVLHNKTELNI